MTRQKTEKRRVTLLVEVEYEPSVTEPSALAHALGRAMDVALAGDELDEYGELDIGEFEVVEGSEQ